MTCRRDNQSGTGARPRFWRQRRDGPVTLQRLARFFGVSSLPPDVISRWHRYGAWNRACERPRTISVSSKSPLPPKSTDSKVLAHLPSTHDLMWKTPARAMLDRSEPHGTQSHELDRKSSLSTPSHTRIPTPASKTAHPLLAQRGDSRIRGIMAYVYTRRTNLAIRAPVGRGTSPSRYPSERAHRPHLTRLPTASTSEVLPILLFPLKPPAQSSMNPFTRSSHATYSRCSLTSM